MDEDEAPPPRDDGSSAPDATPSASNPPPPAPPPPPPEGGDRLPPLAPWAAPPYQGWGAPATTTGGSHLDIGSILGRTFDTFGREWSLFLVLALPVAVGSVLEAFITPEFSLQFENGVPVQPEAADPWILLAVSVALLTLGGISGMATAVAADSLWRGQPVNIGAVVRRVIAAVPRAVPVWLLLIAFQGAFVVAESAARTAQAATRAGQFPYPPIVVLLAIPIGIAAVVVGVRLSLITPVIVLEEGRPLGVLPRTWRLTHGHAIVLFVLAIVIAVLAFISAWGASLFLLFANNRLIAGIAVALASLVAGPLSGIWVTIAWGDLVGGRHADSPLMSRGRGRWTAVVIVVGLGIVMLLAGLGLLAAQISNALDAS